MSRGQKVLLLVSAFCAAAIFVHTFLHKDGWGRRARVESDLARIDAEITTREARAQELRAQIEALRSRPEVQERVVRDELGYVKKNDLVLEIPAAPPAK